MATWRDSKNKRVKLYLKIAADYRRKGQRDKAEVWDNMARQYFMVRSKGAVKGHHEP